MNLKQLYEIGKDTDFVVGRLGNKRNINFPKQSIATLVVDAGKYGKPGDLIKVLVNHSYKGNIIGRNLRLNKLAYYDTEQLDPIVQNTKNESTITDEMFNTLNFKPNVYVNIKGKGKKYIDNIDYEGKNPDNPFQHLAAFVKDNQSSKDGEWVTWESINFEYPLEDEMINEIKLKDLTEASDKISGTLKKWKDRAENLAKSIFADKKWNKLSDKEQSTAYNAAEDDKKSKSLRAKKMKSSGAIEEEEDE